MKLIRIFYTYKIIEHKDIKHILELEFVYLSGVDNHRQFQIICESNNIYYNNTCLFRDYKINNH